MSNFITNSTADNLKKRLLDLIKKSEELKFLVGFFYFSGVQELYKGLKENPNVKMKVLVGLKVDISNFGLIELDDEDYHRSDEERMYLFLQSVKKSLNSNNFDNEEFYEQIKFFNNMISEGRLIIRKTYKPNHTKLYIFKLEENQIGRSSLFITGSSNLTKAGISTQEEFNVEISDHGFDSADKYFDVHWDEAVKITENDSTKSNLLKVIENETLIKEVTPYEAYVYLLKTYLESFEEKEIGESLTKLIEENGYKAYQYQLDAVKQALAIIENNNGVIIADVVGLGKSVIASSIGFELKKRGLVICPPGLIGDKNKNSGWRKYTEEFKLYDWEVRSSGDLENISEFVNNTRNIEVIVIDEAHRFRNQDTKDYELLKNICRDRIVILLTATPFNNKPGDILSLLKLFITPKKSNITLESNIVDTFKAYKGMFDKLAYIKKYYKSKSKPKSNKAYAYYESLFGEKNIDLAKIKERSHFLATQIKNVLEPVTIRRNRLDLQNNPYYKKEVKDLSKLKDPDEWFFELTKEQSEFYDKIIETYFGDPDEGGFFNGAIYRPFEYDVQQKKIDGDKLSMDENFQFIQQRNLFDFMRRLLVKRFESSFGSFEQSVKNFKKITENVLKFIENSNGKFILDRKLLQKIFEYDEDKIEQELQEYSERILNGDFPKNHKVYDTNKFDRKDEFLKNINDDLKLYSKILKELSELDLINNDPKSKCLLKHLEEEFKKVTAKGEPIRKIIIFSEYHDTVKYLEKVLVPVYKNRLLVIAGDLTAAKIMEINQNFDASYNNQKDDYDILLSTDRLSEGFNLNRAGMVINYDIPWNPVRVIQRVGRINRISKKVFNELNIVNFFPTEKGSELVKSREIASNKMFLIHNSLGEDSKIFDIDEEPTPSGLFSRIQTNPDKLEEESFYTKMISSFAEIREKETEMVKAMDKFPARIKVAKKYDENELLVFLKKGRLYIQSLNYNDENGKVNQVTFEEVIDKIKCGKDEKANYLSDKFWESYMNVKNFKEHRSIPQNELSLEQRALNVINTLLKNPWEDLFPQLDFIRTLKEDILDYGTLSDYSIRRIGNLETGKETHQKKTTAEIEAMIKELGKDYLEKEKSRLKELSKEIIIAVENQKA